MNKENIKEPKWLLERKKWNNFQNKNFSLQV